MRIIYFTTACKKEDYVSFSKMWDSSLNASIQNLHNRFIRSLALTHEVEVFSMRPFSRRYCKLKKLDAETKQEGKITWHYLEIKRNKLLRYSTVTKQCNKILSKMNLKDCIIITDTLNPNVLRNSTKFAKKYNLPIIGVCNNTPSSIHNTGKSYATSILSLAENLSGYITLTQGLNTLYNTYNRANLSFEGVLDDNAVINKENEYGDYIFFNGSLEPNHGIVQLILAFRELDNPKLKLIISGYYPDNETLIRVIHNNQNVINLGNIPSDEVISLASHSLLNVNPLPFTEDFDRYYVPANLVDYFNSNSIVVSVRNRQFMKSFKDDAIWVEDCEIYDLLKGLKAGLSLSKENRADMIKKANADVNKLYSMSVINRRTILFLKQFLKQKE
jgi:glycosyltransferase involved in cell wall biosynthesis